MTAQRIGFALLFVLALVAVSSSQDRRSADFETLEGTWIVELNAPPTPTAMLLTTFARGGTVIANGNNAQPVLRSAWQGVFARNAYLDFTSTWQRWNFDAAGSFTNRNELRMSLQVDRALETWTGIVEVLTLDAAGNVTATRPGTLRARRVELRGPGR